MARVTRREWLAMGISILSTQGALALTIERLTDALGVTKGSFYHHFKGWPDFKTALLDHFETEHTSQVITLVEQEEGAAARLRRLLRIASSGPSQVEVAVRAWALQDAEVRVVQERIDRRRIDYVAALYLDLTGDAEQARLLSQLAYVILVGSYHILPALDASTVRRLYTLLEPLYYPQPGER